MPRQERNERSNANYHEKWQTGYTGNTPGVWNKDVQDWEGIRILAFGLIKDWRSAIISNLSIVFTHFE